MNVNQQCEAYAAAAMHLSNLARNEALTRMRAGRRAIQVWSDEARAYANAIISLRADEAICAEHDHSKQLNDVE